jgi:nitrite reductase (NADH) small subunit
MKKVYYLVGKVGEIPPGTGKQVSVGNDADCVLYYTEEGRYYASTLLCPHQNEPLDRGRLEGIEVVCRRHHLRFNLQNGDCTNAGGYWLRTLEVKIEGEDIFIGQWED